MFGFGFGHAQRDTSFWCTAGWFAVYLAYLREIRLFGVSPDVVATVATWCAFQPTSEIALTHTITVRTHRETHIYEYNLVGGSKHSVANIFGLLSMLSSVIAKKTSMVFGYSTRVWAHLRRWNGVRHKCIRTRERVLFLSSTTLAPHRKLLCSLL